jgi:hypothetical protein
MDVPSGSPGTSPAHPDPGNPFPLPFQGQGILVTTKGQAGERVLLSQGPQVTYLGLPTGRQLLPPLVRTHKTSKSSRDCKRSWSQWYAHPPPRSSLHDQDRASHPSHKPSTELPHPFSVLPPNPAAFSNSDKRQPMTHYLLSYMHSDV